MLSHQTIIPQHSDALLFLLSVMIAPLFSEEKKRRLQQESEGDESRDSEALLQQRSLPTSSIVTGRFEDGNPLILAWMDDSIKGEQFQRLGSLFHLGPPPLLP